MRVANGRGVARRAWLLAITLAGLGLVCGPRASDAAPSPHAPRYSHVFVILEENKDFEMITNPAIAPNIAGFAQTYGVATNFFGEVHPSEANYAALLGGICGYHLFPDFVGDKSDAARANGIENGLTVLKLAMDARDSSPFLAGDLSLADHYLAPIAFYLSLTPDKDVLFDVPGFADWWTRTQSLQSYKDTQPDLG